MGKKSEELKEEVKQEELETLPSVMVMDQAVTVYDGDDYEDDYEGDDEDQSIPKLIIVQKSHDELVAAGFLGKLYSPEMSQDFDKLNVVMLVKWTSRVLWPEPFNKENEPLCRSKDGKTPAGDITNEDGTFLDPMCSSCDWDKSTLGKKGVYPKRHCSYANWSGTKEQPVPPACTEVINLILLDLETEIPFHFCLSSTTLTPFRKELTKPLGYRKMSLTAKRRKEGLGKAMNCMFSFDLSVNPVDRKSDSGNSKLPLFENITELDAATIESCLRWREGLIPYVDIMRNAAVDPATQEPSFDGPETGTDVDDDFS